MKLVRKPFKGSFFYEWQVGPIVMQIRHSDEVKEHFRRIHVWRDTYWRR
jgi:hypothetical protein